MTRYRVYYMKPEHFSRFIMGTEAPTLAKLHETHTYLCDCKADGPNLVFGAMQGDFWSPNGEARDLIEYRGLAHTSMSIGDVFEDTETGVFYYLKMAGLGQLNEKPDRMTTATPNGSVVVFDLPPYPLKPASEIDAARLARDVLDAIREIDNETEQDGLADYSDLRNSLLALVGKVLPAHEVEAFDN